MKHYDLCVIGGGPAGIAAAMRAMDFDKRVLLVEKSQLGGAGLTNGALSSKTFWEIAQSYAAACHLAESCGIEMPVIPFAVVKKQVQMAVSHARGQLEVMIESVNQAHQKGHLDLLYGNAMILSPNEVGIQMAEGTQIVSADHISLATGSHPKTLPQIHIDEEHILSSDGIEKLTDYPDKLVVLGAGVIGCEYATIFALLGCTEVFLIDKTDRILPFEDEDIVRVVERKLEKHGVHVHRNACLTSMQVENGKVVYELCFKDGHTETFHADKALISVGRVPNTYGLGLENVGIRITDRGHVEDISKDTCTNCANISAIGDLTADIALVNVAELEGRFAVEKLYGNPSRALTYDNISTIMFLHPEVAGVGLNEQEARKMNIPYRAASVSYDAIPRAVAMHATDGFVKLLMNPQTGTLLGMRAIGEHASSTIQAVALMIQNKIQVQDLADLIHPHPSITEGIQECARALLGTHIRKGPFVRVWEWNPPSASFS